MNKEDKTNSQAADLLAEALLQHCHMLTFDRHENIIDQLLDLGVALHRMGYTDVFQNIPMEKLDWQALFIINAHLRKAGGFKDVTEKVALAIEEKREKRRKKVGLEKFKAVRINTLTIQGEND